MTDTTADISVVICAYTFERWHSLIDAVSAVKQQTTRPREIIIVIDHNPALAIQTRAHFEDVVVVENREIRGLSGARNSGVAVARGAVIAFVDEDAVPAADWLEQLVAGYADPDVMGIGGAVEPMWLDGRPNWFPDEFDWVVGCTYRGMPLTQMPVRNMIGCNMSFRREVFETVGGFRSGIGRVGTLPVGCEETELCIRASQHWPQKSILYDPNARVHHRVPANRARWSYFRARCFAEGRSKAMIAQVVGAKDSLASERSYTLRTLPDGMMRGVRDLVVRGDRSGLVRALAIVAGLLITTVGYVQGVVLLKVVSIMRSSALINLHNPNHPQR